MLMLGELVENRNVPPVPASKGTVACRRLLPDVPVSGSAPCDSNASACALRSITCSFASGSLGDTPAAHFQILLPRAHVHERPFGRPPRALRFRALGYFFI